MRIFIMYYHYQTTNWISRRAAFFHKVCIGVLTAVGLLSSAILWGEEPVADRSDPIFDDPTSFVIDISESLIHIGSLDSFDITQNGIEAGRRFLEALDSHDRDKAIEARELFTEIIPIENIGGEYTAMKWFLDIIFDLDEESRKSLKNPVYKYYYDYFTENDNAMLKEYLIIKYKLRNYETEYTQRNDLGWYPFLNDLVLFCNPMREQWENTQKLISLLHIQPGETVADVGCGPGLYSWIISELTGKTGQVYALDIKQNHLDLIDDFCKKNNIENIQTVLSEISSLCLEENSLDVVFLCSMYHVVYAETDLERTKFLNDIKKCLKPGGRLIIVDNNPVDDKNLPYHGNYIDKRLIVSQLWYYGFEVIRYEQVVPQRYLLEFRLKEDAK